MCIVRKYSFCALTGNVMKSIFLVKVNWNKYRINKEGRRMSKPVVAIVGRPNVGKSTLFNKLVGQRVAIVNDTPGVTRDRIFGDCEWRGRKISLVDTGGIEPYSDDIILKQMRRQAQLAIEAADVIILVTDLTGGVVATDHDVAMMLQKSGRPAVCK